MPFLALPRGTVGAGEIAEAISDPERAKIFAARIGDLVKENPPTNERVSELELLTHTYIRRQEKEREHDTTRTELLTLSPSNHLSRKG